METRNFDNLVPTKELIKRIKISRVTLNRYIKLGMPYVDVYGTKVFLYDVDKVVEWIKNYRNKKIWR